jgi:hypothetical protein
MKKLITTERCIGNLSDYALNYSGFKIQIDLGGFLVSCSHQFVFGLTIALNPTLELSDENWVNISDCKVSPFEQKSDDLARKPSVDQNVRLGCFPQIAVTSAAICENFKIDGHRSHMKDTLSGIHNKNLTSGKVGSGISLELSPFAGHFLVRRRGTKLQQRKTNKKQTALKFFG